MVCNGEVNQHLAKPPMCEFLITTGALSINTCCGGDDGVVLEFAEGVDTFWCRRHRHAAIIMALVRLRHKESCLAERISQ